MLVKCTCLGSTYEIARRKVLRALVEFRIRGVKTNIPFLASLLTHPTFIEGTCWTTFIDDTPELFNLVGSQNRAQKLLAYLGDLAVKYVQIFAHFRQFALGPAFKTALCNMSLGSMTPHTIHFSRYLVSFALTLFKWLVYQGSNWRAQIQGRDNHA